MSTNIQNFYETTITRNWTATTGDFNVSVAPTIPEGIIVISPSSRTLREIVRYTATGTNAYGPFVTVSNVAHRGLGGTTAQSHTIGEKIRMNITAEHWTEMQADIDSIVAAGLPAGSEGDVMIYTGGNWTAGNLLSDKLLTAIVTLSSADILALHTTPKELLPAPGSGKINIIENILLSLDAGGTAYTNGTATYIYWNGTTTSLTNALSSSYFTSSTDKQIIMDGCSTNGLLDISGGENKSIVLTTGSAYLAGDGIIKLFIKYRILTL